MGALDPELWGYLPEFAVLGLGVAAGLRLRRTHPSAGWTAVAGATLLLLTSLGEFVVHVLAKAPGAIVGEPGRGFLVAWVALGRLQFVSASLLLAAIFLGRASVTPERISSDPASRVRRAGGVTLLVLLYAAVPVLAGHGIGTAGLLLVTGRAHEYLAGQSFGWLGIVVAAASIALPARGAFLAVLGYALLCLLASVFAFASVSDAFFVSALAAVPLLAGAAIVFARCREALRAPASLARPGAVS